MTPRVRWFIRHSCALAGFAYASGMKRLGHRYYFVAVAALYTSSDDPIVVYGGPMPRAVTKRTAAADHRVVSPTIVKVG